MTVLRGRGARRTGHRKHRAWGLLAAVTLLAGCGTANDVGAEEGVAYVLDLHSGAQDESASAVPAVGPLAPGTYAATGFRPSMRFQVGEGWALAYETSEHILLVTGDPEQPASIYAFSVSPETKVTSTPVADATGAAPPSEPFPENYEAWLRAVPHIVVGPRRPVEIGGAQGFAVDIDLSGLPSGRCVSNTSRQQCFYPVELIAFSAGPGGSEGTVHVIDVAGTRVLVFSDKGRFEKESASVLESIRWGVPE
jgi:hypothetical protein